MQNFNLMLSHNPLSISINRCLQTFFWRSVSAIWSTLCSHCTTAFTHIRCRTQRLPYNALLSWVVSNETEICRLMCATVIDSYSSVLHQSQRHSQVFCSVLLLVIVVTVGSRHLSLAIPYDTHKRMALIGFHLNNWSEVWVFIFWSKSSMEWQMTSDTVWNWRTFRSYSFNFCSHSSRIRCPTLNTALNRLKMWESLNLLSQFRTTLKNFFYHGKIINIITTV